MRLFSKIKKLVCYVLICTMILSTDTYASEYVEHSDEIVEIESTLHGGYNSSGEVTWIDYKHATALDVSNNTIINKTSTNYNADILDDGICTVYYPG